MIFIINFARIFLVILVLSVLVAAQTGSYANSRSVAQAVPSSPTKVAEITPKRLIVNGRVVTSVIVRIDNRLYVSLEDLSSALNGAVTLKGDDVIASIGSEQAIPASAVPISSGSIRGTLTYFSNSNRGNLPDTGAEVALVPGKLEVPPTSEVIMLGPQDTVIGGKKVVLMKMTTADGAGNYSLQDVPAGEYTVLLKSNHAIGASQRDIAGKVRTAFLTVEVGKTVDVSKDFGISAF